MVSNIKNLLGGINWRFEKAENTGKLEDGAIEGIQNEA